MIIGIFFSVVFLVGLCILIAMLMINKKSTDKWFCEKLGWHKCPEQFTFDGCSLQGICPRCGKRVLLDSQGNWF